MDRESEWQTSANELLFRAVIYRLENEIADQWYPPEQLPTAWEGEVMPVITVRRSKRGALVVRTAYYLNQVAIDEGDDDELYTGFHDGETRDDMEYFTPVTILLWRRLPRCPTEGEVKAVRWRAGRQLEWGE
jgi:hypothetical protein